DLHEARAVAVVAVTAHICMDGFPRYPPLLERAVHTELLGRSDGAVEGHPRHDLGIGELLAPAAYFPDSLVGIGPDRLEMVEQRALDPPSPLVLAQAAESRLIERVHELAVDIELQLGVRRVADADGAGTLIAGQPRYLPLRQPPLAGDGIHDLKLVGTAGNRAKEPSTPCPRLVVIPCSHQRKQ